MSALSLSAVAHRPSREDERRWVEAAAAGDASAFRRIVEEHHRPLYLMAARLVGDPVEAQDLVQDSLAKAYLNLERFDPSFRLSTWLHRITLNTCRDHLKSPRRRERVSAVEHALEETDDAPRPDEELHRRREAERVHAALHRLKPSYREVLVLKDMQELSYREIKAITGSPITALKIRAVRARNELRRLLESEA